MKSFSRRQHERGTVDGPARRRFLGLLGAGAASTLLAACLPGQPTPGAGQGQPIQLVYQDWRTDWFPGMAQEMLARFHAEHPDIRVFYVPDPVNVEEQLPADMRNGNAPDVFAACCAFFPIIGQQGYALDLRSFVAEELDQATIDDWDPAQYRALATREGVQYGLPKYHGALALYYNKDLFDRYDVDYPDYTWNHDDYLDAMRRLTQDRDGDGKTDLWGSMFDVSWERIQVHVNGWGGHFVDPTDPTRSRMGDPEALAAVEWLRARIWDDHVMATPLDVNSRSTRQAFVDQSVAMIEDGSWSLKDILANARFHVGVAPFPAGPVQRATLTTTDGFGIYARTHDLRAAKELLKFLISPDYGRAMARANFLQPARASLVQDWVGYIREEFPDQARDLDIAAFADGQINGYSVTAEIFPNMAAAQRLASAAWQEIFVLGQAPARRMAEVSQQIEAAQQGSN
jgi:multiple sugar transport system substrate-binding protein